MMYAPRLRAPWMTPLLVAIAVGGWLLASPATVATRSEERPADLQGTWLINPDLSDDPREAMEARRKDFGGRPPGGFGGFGGPGGGRGRGTGGPVGLPGPGGVGPDPEHAARVREVMRGVLAGPDRMTITQDAALVVIDTNDGAVHRMQVDGKKRKEMAGSVEIDRRVKWDDGRLVLEVDFRDSPARYRQTWLRAGSRLTVTTKMDGPTGGEAATVRRVYELDASEAR